MILGQTPSRGPLIRGPVPSAASLAEAAAFLRKAPKLAVS
jgi:hypothetical protein